MMNEAEASNSATGSAVGMMENITRKYQYVLDKSSPQVLYRWIFCVVLFAGYFLRVYYLNGWFIVTYGLGIYLLNQFIGFLSPQVSSSTCVYMCTCVSD